MEVSRFLDRVPLLDSLYAQQDIFFKVQLAHLLGQLPCWENKKQHVYVSWGPPYQMRSHTETTMSCLPSSLGHLAMIHPTVTLSHIPHVTMCASSTSVSFSSFKIPIVIIQKSPITLQYIFPPNFWLYFLCEAGCCCFKRTLIVRWADNPSDSLPGICQSQSL